MRMGYLEEPGIVLPGITSVFEELLMVLSMERVYMALPMLMIGENLFRGVMPAFSEAMYT